MSRPISSWNDDDLDREEREMKRDIARIEGQMKAGFAAVDERFEKVEGEMKAGFAAVDERFEKVEGEMKAGFAELKGANERLYHLLFGSAVSIVVVLIAALAAALTT